ncbi:MAG: Nif3-like dinuclear metal center hexameric protein [Defluviitaleaceae bacterium]|nr:Nif3-like dinuclear metal center hexameric protein [Defluviitaleaceae bacterium]
MNIKEIISVMETLAPPQLALDWDNTGLLIGDENNPVNNILLALDISDETINEAIAKNAQLIITHHPIIFKGIKSITTKTAYGRQMIKLIQNNIAVFTSHTNLDITEPGVNDSLFNALELQNKGHLKETQEGYFLGRIGDTIKPYTLSEYAAFVAKKLNIDIVRYVGDDDAKITRVAICGGAASDMDMFALAVKKGAQVYITGDIRYHETQKAQGIGLNLIDATHYATENLALPDVASYLTEKLQGGGICVSVSQVNLQPFKRGCI